MISQTRKDMYIQSAEASSSVDYTDLLPDIKVPALIIIGELDAVTSLNHAKLLNKLIQTSTLEIMAGVGNLLNRENPESFNKILKSDMNVEYGTVRRTLYSLVFQENWKLVL